MGDPDWLVKLCEDQAEWERKRQELHWQARQRALTLALQRRFLTPYTLRPGDILPAERSGEWQTKPQP